MGDCGARGTSFCSRIDGPENKPSNHPPQAQSGLHGIGPSCVIGIDPGLSGAVAFYFPEAPDRVIAEDMPVAAGMVDCATLAAHPANGAWPRDRRARGIDAKTRRLKHLQIRHGLRGNHWHLGGSRNPHGSRNPQVWKKHFRLDSDKEKGRALALRTFAKTPEHFARKKDHGRAEAALLALYGAITEGGTRP